MLSLSSNSIKNRSTTHRCSVIRPEKSNFLTSAFHVAFPSIRSSKESSDWAFINTTGTTESSGLISPDTLHPKVLPWLNFAKTSGLLLTSLPCPKSRQAENDQTSPDNPTCLADRTPTLLLDRFHLTCRPSVIRRYKGPSLYYLLY